MGFKKLFNEEQWKEFQLAVGYVFLLIANADGKIDKKELDAMNRIINSAGRFGMPFPDEILTSIKESGRDILFDAKEAYSPADEIFERVSITSKIAGLDESTQYRKFLISIGLYIGQVSGKFLQAKLCREEEEVLAEFARKIHFDYKMVTETGIADSIIEKIID